MTGDVAAALVLDVRAVRSHIRDARRAVVAHLTAHALPSVVVDDLELVTSELVTNAVMHSPPGSSVHVEVCVRDVIALEVSNDGSAAAIPPVTDWRLASPQISTGRGLGIVRRLCDEVTVEQRGARAVVSCLRRVPDGGVMP